MVQRRRVVVVVVVALTLGHRSTSDKNQLAGIQSNETRLTEETGRSRPCTTGLSLDLVMEFIKRVFLFCRLRLKSLSNEEQNLRSARSIENISDTVGFFGQHKTFQTDLPVRVAQANFLSCLCQRCLYD